MVKKLTPLKPKVKRLDFVGFDCETYSNKNIFQTMAFYFSDKYEEFCRDKEAFIELLHKGIFRDKVIVATNLSFDFNVLFDKFIVQEFSLLYRGTKLLKASAYFDHELKRIVNKSIYDGLREEINEKFARCKNILERNHIKKEYYNLKNRFYKIEFIDTIAYAPFGVAKLGKIIGVPKLECPLEYGIKCKNDVEYTLMRTYNMNDAKISKLFMDYFQEVTIEIGGNLKTTISSSSVYLYRCKYLKQKYFCQPIEVMDKIFNAYYGGRTEAFVHGKFKMKNNNPLKMYDINSLYPSVLMKEFPNPNTARTTRKTDIEIIKKYDGVSFVKINCPNNIKIPLLAYKTKSKLYFPVGTFEGWYSHVELRRAMEIGYTILEIKEHIYYLLNDYPFKEFIEDLYNKRLKYQEEKNPMGDAVKLYMNSFYGKLAERYKNKENIVSKKYYEEKENDKITQYDETFLRVINDVKPKCHTMPIWAVYVTAYARLKLYDYLTNYNVLYCDTDSIITTDEVETSNKLGDMKLELQLSEGYIIRPKFYALKDFNKKEDKVKIKGLPLHYSYEQFEYLLKNTTVNYKKFVQFKEGIKRKLDINEILHVSKCFKTEDTKRKFESQEIYKLYSSVPIDVNDIKEKNIYYSDIDTDFTYHIE